MLSHKPAAFTKSWGDPFLVAAMMEKLLAEQACLHHGWDYLLAVDDPWLEAQHFHPLVVTKFPQR